MYLPSDVTVIGLPPTVIFIPTGKADVNSESRVVTPVINGVSPPAAHPVEPNIIIPTPELAAGVLVHVTLAVAFVKTHDTKGTKPPRGTSTLLHPLLVGFIVEMTPWSKETEDI